MKISRWAAWLPLLLWLVLPVAAQAQQAAGPLQTPAQFLGTHWAAALQRTPICCAT
ncbi:hypothetical protein [Hymenobacter sp. DG25B]|uniref:hypothetical protein n=1 Tax=Hymenobacter sp. DG25B TaxID=1385664 RepID=UPI000A9A9BA4|nr:hypothetical protein [Hymenobacter sp. DG25B]